MSDAQGSGDQQGQDASETEAQRRERERQEAMVKMTAKEVRELYDGRYLKKEVVDQMTGLSEAEKLSLIRPAVTKKPRGISNSKQKFYSQSHAIQQFVSLAANGAAKFNSCEEYTGAFSLAAKDVRELGVELSFQYQILSYLINVRTFSVKVHKMVLDMLEAKNLKDDEWNQDLWCWVFSTVRFELHYERSLQQGVSVQENATVTKSKRNRKKKLTR